MKDDAHRLKVRVLKKDGYWVGLSDDLAGGSTGDTLPFVIGDRSVSARVSRQFGGIASCAEGFVSGKDLNLRACASGFVGCP